MHIEADLTGILNLLRRHIEIRNRSWMKRIHRDCFIGSEAVDFLVTQGLADTRKQAVEIGRRMLAKKLIRHVTDSQKFGDSYHYYRFAEDDLETSILAETNAGNGQGTHLGHGGCKWSFCPHTVHNSYVLDIALAEEIERAVSGASIEARMLAIGKLRSRVREQAEADAPDWNLSQSSTVNNTQISVFQRKRPRGEWKNVKMTGMVGESPIGFIKGIMNFQKRKQWESMFEDGVIVEGIDIGEPPSALMKEDEPTTGIQIRDVDDINKIALPESAFKTVPAVKLARKTDDVVTFLQTVDLAGVPVGMAVAFLNDPERQHALAHLRKQMMLSNPQECMLCQTPFESSADIRFCPCCAMVSCASCVSKRVFEVVSRQVVSICVHCFRESSRIRHPPAAVQDTTGIDEAVRGKWWRPEDLGIIDYSQSFQNSNMLNLISGNASNPKGGAGTVYNEADDLVLEGSNIRPLIPGILDEDVSPLSPTSPNRGKSSATTTTASRTEDSDDDDGDAGGDGDDWKEYPQGGSAVTEVDEYKELEKSKAAAAKTPASPAVPIGKSAAAPAAATPANPKTARCKSCGLMISRDIEAIEAHMEECTGTASGRKSSVAGKMNSVSGPNDRSYVLGQDGSFTITHGTSRQFGGIIRRSDLDQCGTRIIYRTARTQKSKMYLPREMCTFQDSFVDPDGSAYVYEISVRHCEVRGIPDYMPADVMLLMHVAKPVKGSKTMSNITIISQVDTRTKGPQWLMSFVAEEGSDNIGVLGKDDLVRELKSSGNLQNILKKEQESEEDQDAVTLDDFELLAVLGRGGFGKVMQVRHRPTNEVYAMKILKKSELRRRRQVERTQTERTILANVRHPFIVCLHYAFQNSQKLYMVMDFVQGGDFFTLMRKFKRIPEDWVRIYVIEIAMALQHLHDMDVVYRDLKPENILLCGDGHLKLTDFGLSRFFETRPPAAEDMIGDDDVVTRSFCGTEQYMSPEMLLQQGHNHRMDWWCLGLLMHEMISARHPFHGPSHYDTLRNMVTKPPNIDPRLSPVAAAVVKNFLIKNPKARLCCREGISEMKALPYFSVVDWEAIFERKINMPYKPKLQGDTDISSFETTFTREKPVDSVTEAENTETKKKTGKGGILGFLGYGSNNNAKQEVVHESDSFKGFSFTKEEEMANSVAGGRSTFSNPSNFGPGATAAAANEAANIPPPAPAPAAAPAGGPPKVTSALTSMINANKAAEK